MSAKSPAVSLPELPEAVKAAMDLASAADDAESAWCAAPSGSGKSRATHMKFESARDDAAEAAYQLIRAHGPTILAALRAAGDGREDARDAARYRWLRDESKWDTVRSIIYGENCDAAIDAAMGGDDAR